MLSLSRTKIISLEKWHGNFLKLNMLKIISFTLVQAHAVKVWNIPISALGNFLVEESEHPPLHGVKNVKIKENSSVP